MALALQGCVGFHVGGLTRGDGGGKPTLWTQCLHPVIFCKCLFLRISRSVTACRLFTFYLQPEIYWRKGTKPTTTFALGFVQSAKKQELNHSLGDMLGDFFEFPQLTSMPYLGDHSFTMLSLA